MNDRVLEMEVSGCCSGKRACHDERYGLVGEFPRFVCRNCLDLASQSRNPYSSSGAQHLWASSNGRRNPRLCNMLDHPNCSHIRNRSVGPFSGEKRWVNFIGNTRVHRIITTEQMRSVFRMHDKASEVSRSIRELELREGWTHATRLMGGCGSGPRSLPSAKPPGILRVTGCHYLSAGKVTHFAWGTVRTSIGVAPRKPNAPSSTQPHHHPHPQPSSQWSHPA